MRKYHLPSGQLMHMVKKECGQIRDLALTPQYAEGDDGWIMAGVTNDGLLSLWDYESSHEYCRMRLPAVKGSLESETGLLCCEFDNTGSILLAAGYDKAVKVLRLRDEDTPESRPIKGFVAPEVYMSLDKE
ncbi:hypothetical protein KIPB_011931 [Kipferlia bialata]|uniref:Uncharacterized protein n=1 Tax=Kipferlia bialata TaxID=797122 RepID=A0A9K3GNJ3_9EUKA|nr:hypothetical protein KIPB_011931 [Kipferlia bialata]|eukprot:g11931.t1